MGSTELLLETASAWVSSGDMLPVRHGQRGATVDNRVLMTGERSGQSRKKCHYYHNTFFLF